MPNSTAAKPLLIADLPAPARRPEAEPEPPPLEGRFVRLRPIRQADVETLYELRTAPEILHLWLGDGGTPSLDLFRQELDMMSRSPHHVQFAIVLRRTDEVVGTIYTQRLNLNDGHTYLTVAILPKLVRRLGCGAEAAALFLNYLFAYFRIRKVYSEVLGYNRHSLRANLSAGFREEGRLKEFKYFRGRCWDLHILAMDRENFEQSPRRVRSNLG